MNGGSFKAWVQASRAPFFVATLIPLGLGASVSFSMGEWNLGRWLLVSFGVIHGASRDKSLE